jgi:hypothetical protein
MRVAGGPASHFLQAAASAVEAAVAAAVHLVLVLQHLAAAADADVLAQHRSVGTATLPMGMLARLLGSSICADIASTVMFQHMQLRTLLMRKPGMLLGVVCKHLYKGMLPTDGKS